ncbi:nucleotidyltransferase family protein [Paenibacillus nanensis]|nr:nucleotidyltransferase family protein [Paenibacillus nanensis]
MGFPKLSVELEKLEGGEDGSKLGGCGLRSALLSHCRPVIVVTKPGPAPDWLPVGWTEDAWDGLVLVTADDAEQGMAYSIRAGIAEAMRYKPKAVLVLLADQPLVTTEMIERLVARWHMEPEIDYAAYCKGEAPTPPILLSAAMFPSLLALSGDHGARKLLKEPRVKGALLQAEQDIRLTDIDTVEDLVLFMRERRHLSARKERGSDEPIGGADEPCRETVRGCRCE